MIFGCWGECVGVVAALHVSPAPQSSPSSRDSRRDRYVRCHCVWPANSKKKTRFVTRSYGRPVFSPAIRSEGRPSSRLAPRSGGSSNLVWVLCTLVWKRPFFRSVLADFHRNALRKDRDVIRVFARFTRTFASTCRSDDFGGNSSLDIGTIDLLQDRYSMTKSPSVYWPNEIVRNTQRYL